MPKNIMLATLLPAAPERLFDMYLDQARMRPSPVTIETRAGAPFRAFNGAVRIDYAC